MTEAVIGLGSSLGNRERQIRAAVQALDATRGMQVVGVSRLYQSVPMGAARSAFLNGAVRVQTSGSARGLLRRCKEIERRLLRQPATHWADRTIDLDLLVFGQAIRTGRDLTLPHAGLLHRAFALIPAREVASDLVHPVVGRTLGEVPDPPGQGVWPVGTLCRPAPPRARRAGCGLAGARPRTSPLRHGVLVGSRTMKFFIDTANLDHIREVASWGILDGATTNPSLVAREGGDFVDSVYQICEILKGPVSAETVSQQAEGMIREGRMLSRVSEHVVVKVPMSIEGLKACRVLADDGIDVNVTLIFQAAQALIAAKAGAAYVSPFLGRLDDLATDGVDLIEQIAAIFGNDPSIGTEILAASIRHPLHVAQVAMAGADVATIPYNVLSRLVNHPLTDIGNQKFLADWDKVPDNDICAQVSRWLETRGSSEG